MPRTKEDHKAILFFQELYIDHYIFNYKPSMHMVLKQKELRLEKVIRRRRLVQIFLELVPLVVHFQSVALASCCIFIMSTIPHLILWSDLRFWGWFAFGTASGVVGFLYYLIGTGKNGNFFLQMCNEFADLEEDIRTGNL